MQNILAFLLGKKRCFYEKVTDVNTSSLFFLRWGTLIFV